MKKIYLIAIISFTLLISGCNDNIINSVWKTNDIKIDGNDSDWGNSLTYVKDSNLLFGVQNDDKYLYLCLATNDQDLQTKILRLGLTIWFDTTGGDNEIFGIKYPLSFQDLDHSNFNFGKNENFTPEEQNFNHGNMNEKMLMRQTDVEILGKNKNDYTRIGLSELKGIEIKVNIKNYRFVYEMKIPLVQTKETPYAINTDTSRTIGIGLETGTIDRNKFPQEKGFGIEGSSAENQGGEEPIEGGGGYFGGGNMHPRGSGGYGRQRGDGQSLMSAPLNYWTQVKLASKK